MSSNHNERRKKFIEQLKANGKFVDYKKRRAELEKARRERKKEAVEKLSDAKRKLLAEEERLKIRKRVQKHRLAKMGGTQDVAVVETDETNRNENINRELTSKTTFDFPHSYKTTSAIRKAYTKANKGLPSSPSKRKVIATKIYRSFGEDDRRDILGSNKLTANGRESRISAELISVIEKFYERDDVSRVSPNMKDAKSFRNSSTGAKEIRPLRHLLFTLSDVYAMFTEEYKREKNCDPPVKKSKFCEMRPEHVLRIGETPRNVCFCIYHSNFSQCCIALNKYAPQLPKNYDEMVKLLVCENPTQDCHFKKCKECATTLINDRFKSTSQYSTIKIKSVKWMQWVKDKQANRFQNESQNGTFQQLVDYFVSIYGQFLKHRHVMHEQAAYFNIDQKRVDSNDHFDEATLNIDFSENYKCESQDEIQQANYNQKQVRPLQSPFSFESF